MPSLVGHKSNAPPDTAAEHAVVQSRYVAQLYIRRRKVWEGRASTHEEASNLAKAEKAKYPNTASTIVIKEAKNAE